MIKTMGGLLYSIKDIADATNEDYSRVRSMVAKGYVMSPTVTLPKGTRRYYTDSEFREIVIGYFGSGPR